MFKILNKFRMRSTRDLKDMVSGSRKGGPSIGNKKNSVLDEIPDIGE